MTAQPCLRVMYRRRICGHKAFSEQSACARRISEHCLRCVETSYPIFFYSTNKRLQDQYGVPMFHLDRRVRKVE